MAQVLRLRLLGGFSVAVDGREVVDGAWRRRKARTLVKLLALADRHRLHRDQLIEDLWPDSPPQSGLNSLHQALFAARRAIDSACEDVALGEHHLQLVGELLVLGPPEELIVDVDEFEALAAAAERTHDGDNLRKAIEQYAGELLPADRYEPWSESRREALRRRHHVLVAELAAGCLRDGDHDSAIASVEPAHAEDPLDEGLCRVLIEAYLAADRRTDATGVYRRLVTALRDELDVAPEPETTALLEGRSVQQSATTTPHNLPLRPSSFIGRTRELGEMREVLRHTRLLTLTGPGGCGKTRLSLELGEQSMRAYPGGVYFVELAPLSDGAAVPRAVTSALGIPQSPGIQPQHAAATHFASCGGPILLLLDNCEHVIEASAALAHDLLTSAANLTLVATSRQPLLVPGEVVWRVPSLSLPNLRSATGASELLSCEAVQLFAERARAADPHFEITARNAHDTATLCARLDGLPLALELAAARLRTMPLTEIVARLDDRFALLVGGSRVALTRQQTLRATVDWSHDLLSEPERIVLRRLTVFASGFTLDAAAAVCSGRGLAAAEIPDLVTGLVDRSLVAAGQSDGTARYWLLETMREYAFARLRSAAEAEQLRERHAAWVLDLAAQSAWELAHTGRRAWLRRLAVEQGNLRAAVDHLLRTDPPLAMELSALLWRYWLRTARLVEGMQSLRAALDAVPDRTPVRAHALLGICALTNRAGRISQWDGPAAERLAILTEHGDPHGISRAYYYVGLQAWLVQDLSRAEDAFDTARQIAVEHGLRADEATARYSRAAVAAMQCRYADAEADLTDVLDCARDLVDTPASIAVVNVTPLCVRPPGAVDHRRVVFEETAAPFTEPTGRLAVGYVLANLGSIARSVGDVELARERYEQALRIFEDEDDDVAIGMALTRLGNLAAVTHEMPRAYALLEAGLRSYRRVRDVRGIYQTMATLGYWIAVSGDMARGRAMVARSEAAFRESVDRPGLYSSLSHLGALALIEGDVTSAVRIYTEDVAIERDLGSWTHLGWSLVNLAEATRRDGDLAAAAAHLREARDHFVYTSRPDGIATCDDLLARV